MAQNIIRPIITRINGPGQVTLRTAFAKSLNVPAIEVAEQAGYRNVADLAHKAGLESVRATPSMALGTYVVTAMDMAGAYTIFANGGVMVTPRLISHIADKKRQRCLDVGRGNKADPRSAGELPGGEPDARCLALGYRRRGGTPRIHPSRRRRRPAHRTTLGLLASRQTCCASFGLVSTITKTSKWMARKRPYQFGRVS